MPLDSSPICFRVSEEERVMLEAAASYVGESLSAFMRRAAIDTAEQVMKDGGGVDAVVQRYYTIKRRRAEFATRND
jgi:uncharacterized protein (DUF1778 family)